MPITLYEGLNDASRGYVATTVLSILVHEVLKGKDKPIKLDELASMLGEPVASIEVALDRLVEVGDITDPGRPWSEVSTIEVQSFKLDLAVRQLRLAPAMKRQAPTVMEQVQEGIDRKRCGTVPFQVGTSMAQAVVSAVDGAFDVFELTLEILDPHLGTLPIECDSVLSFDSPEAAWRWFYEVWVPFQVREEDHSIRAWALSLAASGGGRAGIMPGAFLDLLDELRDEGRLSVEDLEACEQSDRVSIGDIVIEASHDGTPWPGPYVGMHVSLDVPAAEQATEPGPELPNELGERISFEAVEKDGRAGEASFHANDRGWFVQLAFEDDLANVVVSGPHESSDVAHQWLYDWLSAAGDPSDAAAPVKPPKKRPGRPRKAVAVPETSGNISVAPTGEVVLAHPAPNGGGGDVEEQ